MLNLQSIQTFFPGHVQQASRFMLREYLQCRILEPKRMSCLMPSAVIGALNRAVVAGLIVVAEQR